MTNINYDKIILLVGLGAPADLYLSLVTDLQANLQLKIEIITWWDTDDCGVKLLDSVLKDSKVMIIAHSAGGIIALRALLNYADNIKRLVLLDTHILYNTKFVHNVADFVEILIKNDDEQLKSSVRQAYVPLVQNHKTFDKSLNSIIEWNNQSIEQALLILQQQPIHSVFYIGFTDHQYQPYNAVTEQDALKFWKQYVPDVEFMHVSHFGFVDPAVAKELSDRIIHLG